MGVEVGQAGGLVFWIQVLIRTLCKNERKPGLISSNQCHKNQKSRCPNHSWVKHHWCFSGIDSGYKNQCHSIVFSLSSLTN